MLVLDEKDFPVPVYGAFGIVGVAHNNEELQELLSDKYHLGIKGAAMAVFFGIACAIAVIVVLNNIF